jgi:hypothetical protein
MPIDLVLTPENALDAALKAGGRGQQIEERKHMTEHKTILAAVMSAIASSTPAGTQEDNWSGNWLLGLCSRQGIPGAPPASALQMPQPA